eukprot:m.237751 g.237751  ORF g.237751 m.237751 type:complete len:113 (-) comp15277_c1_seq4:390-728(-)
MVLLHVLFDAWWIITHGTKLQTYVGGFCLLLANSALWLPTALFSTCIRTIMEQNAEISVPSMSFVEKTIASTIATNSQKGREAMEWVVDKIKEEFLPTPAACEEASRQSSSV